MSLPTIVTKLLLLLSLVLLCACSIKMAKPIDEKIENIPDAQTVSRNFNAYIGRRVRWGGVIASVLNEKEATVIEIVTRPLDKQGRPILSDQTYGRFLARIKGFLDPLVYTKGREMTIVGSIVKQSIGDIGNYQYSYTEVMVDTFKFWPPVTEQPEYYYDPFMYGPWYPRYWHPTYYYPWWYY